MKYEIAFEKKFLKRLKKEMPRVYIPPKVDPGAIRGLPDRTVCVAGKYVALEFKRSMKDALINAPRHALQMHTLEDIQRAGGYTAVVYPEIEEQIFKKIKDLYEQS